MNESVNHTYEPIYLEVTHEKEINVVIINVSTIILLHFPKRGKEKKTSLLLH